MGTNGAAFVNEDASGKGQDYTVIDRKDRQDHHEHGHQEGIEHDLHEHDHHAHEAIHTNASHHHHHSHAASSAHLSGHHLLQIEGLSVSFRMYEEAGSKPLDFLRAKKHTVNVIKDLSISVHAGELLAVVGASGSGKTLLADSILGIFEPNSKVKGRVFFDGEEMSGSSLASLRGSSIAFIPQRISALDPLMKVGRQVCESKMALSAQQYAEREARAKSLFERYGLDAEVMRMYPHQLSGGMARRVLLCMALIDDPKLIIADEPTPGMDLDLAVQALSDLRKFADDGGGVMLITHDLELALEVADRIAIFKDGTVIEETSTEAFKEGDLAHPFSLALREAMP